MMLSQKDENFSVPHLSNNPFSTGKKTMKIALSDTNVNSQSSVDSLLSPPKRYCSAENAGINTIEQPVLKKSPSLTSNILKERENSNSQPAPQKRLLSTRSSGSLLFNAGRRSLYIEICDPASFSRVRKKSIPAEKPVEKTESLAVDNNIKTAISFYFSNDISPNLINMIQMAVRRSQVGHFCMAYPPSITTRGNVTPKMLCQFVDGVLDSYQTYISKPYNMLKDEHFFYLKGHNFMAMFTHDREGKCICLASVCSELLHKMNHEDVRYIRMRDEDEDDLAEEELDMYRNNSRLWPQSNSFSQADYQNTGVILQDPLSIHKFVNAIINYSIHLPQSKEMTQILASFPFVSGTWGVTNPTFKRNVMVGKTSMSSLSFPGLILKNQISKLCDVINGVFKVKHMSCSYEIALFSEPLSQSFNTKNSLSTIDSKVLQRVQCEIAEDNRVYYTHTTKAIAA